MIILTGGAGFIGSVVLRRLNEAGYKDILVVDSLGSSEKWKNLRLKSFRDYCHKDHFPEYLTETLLPSDVDAIIHLGACTSTTETDAEYLMRNNYLYSKALAAWCLEHGKRFIYASSAATYGDGSLGFSDDNASTPKFLPQNIYGYSKHAFDLWVLQMGYDDRCLGLKFFNVFGPNEYHKGEMASLVFKSYEKVIMTKKMSLFRSYNPTYRDGESVRDFIYVHDCADVILWAVEHPHVNGIYNLGTGKANTWNTLAASLFNALEYEITIEYIDMPETLRSQYQYFTQAEMQKLRNAGYNKPFTALEDAVADYVRSYLQTGNRYY